MNSIELLSEFCEQRSDSAFGELVRRYTNLVYSVAFRRLGNPALAQDAAQTVFIRLANKPPRPASEWELTGWLHRTTVHVSIDLWRAESRRRAREEHAAAMHLNSNKDLSWTSITPDLDEALNDLNDTDRRVLLLRYFDRRSMRDLGADFGIGEDAAKMRVSRALDRLRDQLQARGVTCTGTALAGFLTDRAVEAAPAEIAAALAAVPYSAASSGAVAATATGFFATATLSKVTLATAAVTMVGLTAWLTMSRRPATNSVVSTKAGISVPGGNPNASVSTSGGTDAVAPLNQAEPDPVQLLHGVARARQRITSGVLEFQVDTFGARFQSTNRLQVRAVFDGSKRRFEQIGREFSYAYDPDPIKQEEIRTKAEAFGFDKEAAVEAGLLKPFESRYVTTYDETSLLRYWENDGEPVSANLDDPKKGSSSYVFDPRCLGLTSSLYPLQTVDGALGGDRIGAAQLLGKETLDGTPAWRVRVPGEIPLEYWLDATNPARVLKFQAGFSTTVSRFDRGGADLLPREVIQTDYRDGTVVSQSHWVLKAAQYNNSVEPRTFTLAGLGMQIGTAVSDVRIHRGIGYWTGSGLSEDLPRKAAVSAGEPTLEDMLAILENYPAGSVHAFDAAKWILLNTPDGPEVEKAAAVILAEHIRSSEMASLCRELERMRHRCAKELLEAAIKGNPDVKVRLAARFTLATLRKDECKYGAETQATVEAEKLFEQVIRDARELGRKEQDLAHKATIELTELRRMSIGKAAPNFKGTDLRGNRVSLAEQRGKVVVVVFLGSSDSARLYEDLRSFESFRTRPFNWIGIFCDDDPGKVQKAVEEAQFPWPIIPDGRYGPIAADWHIRAWPSIFLVDGEGIIRARGVRGPDLLQAISGLIATIPLVKE